MSLRISRKVLSLHIYPVKSCRGLDLTELEIGSSGPLGDREWMIVDETGLFQTQRQIAKMAQIECGLQNGELLLKFGGTSYPVNRSVDTKLASVKVWKSELMAEDCASAEINEALSDFLGKKLKLVRYSGQSPRAVIKKETDYNSEVRFADSAPLLLLNQKSLEDLNSKLSHPIGMERFRGNIVLDGEEPWEEDRWSKLVSPSGLEIEVAYPSTRCVVITRDQKTGESPAGPEVLTKLGEFRRQAGGVVFGMNGVHRLGPGVGSASIKVGESLELTWS